LILYHAAKSAEVKKRGLLAAPDLTLLKPKSYEEVFLMIENGRPEMFLYTWLSRLLNRGADDFGSMMQRKSQIEAEYAEYLKNKSANKD
jgi:hypothetical protein